MIRGYIQTELTGLSKAFDRAARAGLDLSPIFKKMAREFKEDSKQNIDSQKDASGSKWPALATSTVEKIKNAKKSRTKKGALRKPVTRRLGRILSRKLISEAKFAATPREAKFYTEAPYAVPHNFGLTVGRGSKLPVRNFMYVSRALLESTSQRLAQHIADAFESKR